MKKRIYHIGCVFLALGLVAAPRSADGASRGEERMGPERSGWELVWADEFDYEGLPVVTPPAFVAHRGASRDAPENTLPAFNLAWKQGTDAIEADFYLTKDGEIVCNHDARVTLPSGQAKNIGKTTLAELREVDVGQRKGEKWLGTRIPTLDEVLATVPEGKKIYIEIKCGAEILPAMKQAIAGSGLKPEQTVVICFRSKVLAASKRDMPGIRTILLTSFKKDKKTGEVSPSAADLVAALQEIGADGASCKADAALDQDFVRALHAAGKEVHVWTVNKAAQAKHYAQLGLDAIVSDVAGDLKKLLGNGSEKQKKEPAP